MCQHVIFVDEEDAAVKVYQTALYPDDDKQDEEDISSEEWLGWAANKFSRDDLKTIEITMGSFPMFHQLLIGLAAE